MLRIWSSTALTTACHTSPGCHYGKKAGVQFRVKDFGFRVKDLGFRIYGLGLKIKGLGFGASDLEFRV